MQREQGEAVPTDVAALRTAGAPSRGSAIAGWFTRLAALPRVLGLAAAPLTWLEPERLLGCAYPRRDAALAALRRAGVSLLLNLHERPHPRGRLAAYALEEVHLPVRDFTPPSPEQLEQGVAAIRSALAEGRRVAVHCGAGLGRTGTLLACYLVSIGLTPETAIARVRAARPGSVETAAQVAAIHAYAQRRNAPSASG